MYRCTGVFLSLKNIEDSKGLHIQTGLTPPPPAALKRGDSKWGVALRVSRPRRGGGGRAQWRPGTPRRRRRLLMRMPSVFLRLLSVCAADLREWAGLSHSLCRVGASCHMGEVPMHSVGHITLSRYHHSLYMELSIGNHFAPATTKHITFHVFYKAYR